jgi:hypothetical protein
MATAGDHFLAHVQQLTEMYDAILGDIKLKTHK